MRQASSTSAPAPSSPSSPPAARAAALGALLCLLSLAPAPFAQAAPQVACEHGVCFRFPGEDPSYFKPSVPGPGGPYHYDNGCAGAQGRCFCTTYWGADFDHCYAGHEGTDFMLDKGFRVMRQQVEVVAPATGEVVAVDDSNWDRCHASPLDLLLDDSPDGISCGWEVDPATGELQPREVEDNYVIMRHFNGRYYVYSRMVHVMQGSVPQWIKDALSRGEKPHLSCGDLIGYVGSAGQSVAPHVHFEVRFYGTWDTEGQYYRGSSRPPRYDPYCGPFLSESGRTTTYWTELPPPGPGEDGPYGLPGTTCQDPYDPALFQGLPARCLTEDDVRWPAGGR